MGALQPGLPNPAAIPRDTYKIVIDLKDCFYTIPLHPRDRERFAFSVPAINLQRPMQRYQWKVLPQGMANSPTLCQKFVDRAISPIREEYPDVYIIHYMDDILLAHADSPTLLQAYGQLRQSLQLHGLQIASEKVQSHAPYSYLGYTLHPAHFHPQKLVIRTEHLKTLNDFQKLLGDINWIRPSLCLSTAQLLPLFNTLKGDADPTSPRELTTEARQSLQIVERALAAARLTYCDYRLPWDLIILPSRHAPTGVLYQGGVLTWIHGKASPSKNLMPYYELVAHCIRTGRKLSTLYLGQDPATIILPYTAAEVDWLLNMCDSFSLALASFAGNIQHHLPKDKILHFLATTPHTIMRLTSHRPIAQATTAFTDGSSTGIAVLVLPNEVKTWTTPYSSAQPTELFAVLQAFLAVPGPLNIYSDSHYVVTSLQHLEVTPLLRGHNSTVLTLFTQLQQAIHDRQSPFFIAHIRSHSQLPGPLHAANALADSHTRLMALVAQTPLQNATDSHRLHHQSAKSLRQQFHITREQAREIVRNCPACAEFLPVPHYGVNPRGLCPNDLWQMNVTHVASFGRLQYVHVTIDTCSHFMWATCLSGENVNAVQQHLLHCFAVMGTPREIKTDNAPAYTSASLRRFAQQFHFSLKTGIPYNPQGQGIVERAHQVLKHHLVKLKKGGVGGYTPTPQKLLMHTLFVINFLTLDDDGRSAADRFWNPQRQAHPLVLWRDPLTGAWHGPDPALMWGRGYVCVFPTDAPAPRWLPARCVKHAPNQDRPASPSIPTPASDA